VIRAVSFRFSVIIALHEAEIELYRIYQKQIRKCKHGVTIQAPNLIIVNGSSIAGDFPTFDLF
jgi:hypothetical protein